MNKQWLLAPVFATTGLLVACGGGSSDDSDSTNPGDNSNTATLELTVQGLPEDASADVMITGPANYSQALDGSASLNALATGSYQLSATAVAVNQAIYQPDQESIAINLSDNGQERVTVTYRADVDSEGVVTGFGSVFVNGVRYETTSQQQAGLKVGMKVNLKGKQGADGQFAVVDSIVYDATAKGVISAIDYAQLSFRVLGQSYRVDDKTKLAQDFTDLSVGDYVELSAIRQAAEGYIATRIELAEQGDELELEGIISELDELEQRFNVGELVIDYSQAEEVEGTLSDGTIVEIEASNAPIAGVLLADKVEVKSASDSAIGSLVKIEGLVAALDDNTVTVNDKVITLAQSTQFIKGDRGDLSINSRVYILAVNTDNGLQAQHIRFDKRSEIKVAGKVQTTNPEENTFMLHGVTYMVDEFTQYEDDSSADNQQLRLDNLNSGDVIKVEAFQFENSYIVRDLERLAVAGQQTQRQYELEGRIAAIDETEKTLTIANQTVVLNGATELELEDEVDLETFLQQVKVGDEVEVEYVEQDQTLLAIAVEVERDDEDLDNREFELNGVVSALNPIDGHFTLANKIVFYNQDTEFEDGEISVGDTLEVEAVQRADGSILALAVEIDGEDKLELEVKGVISQFNSISDFVVADQAVAANDETEYQHGTASDLAVGVSVEVEGYLDDNNILIAEKLDVERDDIAELEIEGTIRELESLADEAFRFVIDEQTVQLNAQTEFKNGNSAKLANGVEVEVEGYLQDQLLMANKLEFEAVRYVEIEGPVTEILSNTEIKVLDTRVRLTEQSEIKNGSWTDIVVGTNVEVEGVVVIEEGVRIIQAEKIELQEDALLELEGLVSDYNDDHFTIKGAKVFITENTVFKHGQRQSLANGVEVEVKARPLGDKLVAIEIEFED